MACRVSITGNVTVRPPSGSLSFVVGPQVTRSAPRSGYLLLDGFTVRPAVVERYTRIMGAGVYQFENFDTSYIVFRVQGVIPARMSL